ncbi:3'-5' exonuclease [Oscillatoria laete-virens NRMC-F 0139]|nr:3'-5' exonuclease [Oscillatoria laete-virens]MDL5055246.1 3'-5' exonuclease [Oscillatoria laete-virens NRMC-F 0139]
MLCYNVSLAAYLRHLLAEHPHITVTHFDGWAKAQGLVRYPNEPDDKLGQRFLNSLCKHKGKHETFDAVLIDEAQDFCPNWFSCARAMLKDPDEGDFLIVGDGAQGLYRHRNFHWSDVGIKAAGRTISARFRLDRNYRNSAEIVRLAAQFAQAGEFNEDEGIAALKVDPVNCVRSTGHMPILHDPFPTRQAEAAQIAQIVDGLLKGIWDNQPIGAPLLPENIALLYRKCSDSFKPADGSGKTDREHMENLIETLRPVCPVRWISDKTHYSLREEVCEDGLKIQTIHSSKGLQYRAVIVIWADQMPFTKYGVTEDDENRLFYVALTRAEDFLAITYTGKSPLTEKLETMK